MIIDIWAGKHLIRKTLEEYRAEYIAVSGRTKLIRLAFREFRKIKDAILIEKVFEAEQIENIGRTQEKPRLYKVSGSETAVLTMTKYIIILIFPGCRRLGPLRISEDSHST